MTAETKGVRSSDANPGCPSYVGNVIQVTFWVRVLQIYSRWYNIFFRRFTADQCLYGSGSSQHMAQHRFCGADGDVTGMATEHGLDSQGLGLIIEDSRGPVGIDIIDIFGGEVCLTQGHPHGADGAFPIGGGLGHMATLQGHRPNPTECRFFLHPESRGIGFDLSNYLGPRRTLLCGNPRRGFAGTAVLYALKSQCPDPRPKVRLAAVDWPIGLTRSGPAFLRGLLPVFPVWVYGDD